MKKIIFIPLFFLCSLYAEGPIRRHKEPEKQLEFENVYQDLRQQTINKSSGTITSFTATSGTFTVISASSMTVNFLTATSFIASSATLHGTSMNDNACVGCYGEYISSVTSNPTLVPTTAQFGDLAAITLTAGDWDISGVGSFTIAVGVDTWTSCSTGISSTAGNDGTGLVVGDNRVTDSFASSNTTPNIVGQPIPAFRVKPTTTTTYYLKIRSTYTVGQPQATGRISARRPR